MTGLITRFFGLITFRIYFKHWWCHMWWVYVSLCLYEFIGTGNCSMLDGTKLLPTLRLKYQFYLLWPSGIISQQYRSGSTLAQVMAWCLTAPSQYLNQSWLIICGVEWHSSECNFIGYISAINHWNKFGNKSSKLSSKSLGGQWP